MIQKIIVTAALLGYCIFPLQAQRCEIIGMDHFGGNGGDICTFPNVIENTDGSHSLTIGTVSTAGSIKTDCLTPIGNYLFRTYNADFTSFEDKCAFVGQDFRWPSFLYFPQSNGDTIIFGDTQLDNQGIIAERRNAAGAVVWNKTYGGSSLDGFLTAVALTDGGFLVSGGSISDDGDVGMHYGNTASADMWVFRLDNDGNVLWSTVIGGSGTDLCRDFKLSPDGGCYIFGVTTSSDYDAIGNHGSSDLFVAKLDSLGHKEWSRCYGGSEDEGCGYDMGIKAIEDGHGGYYVLNRATSHDGDVQRRLPDATDFWLLHIDSMGNILWENTYGGPGYQFPSSFCMATDGSLWMGGTHRGDKYGGQIDTFYGNTDCWVVHADTLGNFINQCVLGGSSEDVFTSLSPLPDGTVMAVGRYLNSTGNHSFNFPTITEGFGNIFLGHLGPNTVVIREAELPAENWELFPNPAKNRVTVRVISNHQPYSLVVTDAVGREVYRDRVVSASDITTLHWKPGIYLVKLTGGDGTSGTKKLTIQP